MRFRDLARPFALLFAVLLVGCADDGGVAVRTEVNLDIVHPSAGSQDLGFTIDRVEYRATCEGSTPGSIPLPPADTTGSLYGYDDTVDMSGAFEIIDTRNPPIWQAAMDLPPGECVLTMSVWDGDEVVCLGSRTLTIEPGVVSKFDITLVCSVSVDTPEGTLSVDGTLDLIQGNACPQLTWLGADPTVVDPLDPVSSIQTYSFDPDNTCGENCDPQTCDNSVNPPVCTAGPDLGLTSTFYAPSGVGTFGDVNAFDTTYSCDPLFPGPTEICALASDGDLECDRTRCLTIVCP